MKTSMLFGTALLLSLTAISSFAGTKNGGVYLTDPEGDGPSTLTITGEAASALYDSMTTQVLVADPQVRGGYTMQTNLKTGRDLSCSVTRYTRVAPGAPEFRDGWGRKRPDAYSETSCQTQVNTEGKLGLDWDRRDRDGRPNRPGPGPGPGPVPMR